MESMYTLSSTTSARKLALPQTSTWMSTVGPQGERATRVAGQELPEQNGDVEEAEDARAARRTRWRRTPAAERTSARRDADVARYDRVLGVEQRHVDDRLDDEHEHAERPCCRGGRAPAPASAAMPHEIAAIRTTQREEPRELAPVARAPVQPAEQRAQVAGGEERRHEQVGRRRRRSRRGVRRRRRRRPRRCRNAAAWPGSGAGTASRSPGERRSRAAPRPIA